MKTGDRVIYADEGTKKHAERGTVVEPTAEEVESGKAYEYPVGPEQGDVLVAWDDGERFWEDPNDLTVVDR